MSKNIDFMSLVEVKNKLSDDISKMDVLISRSNTAIVATIKMARNIAKKELKKVEKKINKII